MLEDDGEPHTTNFCKYCYTLRHDEKEQRVAWVHAVLSIRLWR